MLINEIVNLDLNADSIASQSSIFHIFQMSRRDCCRGYGRCEDQSGVACGHARRSIYLIEETTMSRLQSYM